MDCIGIGVVDEVDVLKGVSALIKVINVVNPVVCVKEYADKLSGHICGVGIRLAVGEGHFNVLYVAVGKGICAHVTGSIITNKACKVVEAAHLSVLDRAIGEFGRTCEHTTDKSCNTEGNGMTTVCGILIGVIQPTVELNVGNVAVFKGHPCVAVHVTDKYADVTLPSLDLDTVKVEVLEFQIVLCILDKAKAVRIEVRSILQGLVGACNGHVLDGMAVTLKGHAIQKCAVNRDPIVACKVDIRGEVNGYLKVIGAFLDNGVCPCDQLLCGADVDCALNRCAGVIGGDFLGGRLLGRSFGGFLSGGCLGDLLGGSIGLGCGGVGRLIAIVARNHSCEYGQAQKCCQNQGKLSFHKILHSCIWGL